MKRTRLAYPYIFVWMPLFIVAPMLFVAYYAFFDNGTFTTEYVKQVFSSTTYLPALWNSIWIALATTAVSEIAVSNTNISSRTNQLIIGTSREKIIF